MQMLAPAQIKIKQIPEKIENSDYFAADDEIFLQSRYLPWVAPPFLESVP
jgi:hypothetical protein